MRHVPSPGAGTAPGLPAGLPWLTDHAWPQWLEHGVDWQRRAFHEHLDLATLACGAGFRRLRVAARQTYVFAAAAAHGVPGAADAVALGLDFLRGPARLADGGYAWRFDLANQPVDHTRDLYDHAFVLLAYAAAAPVYGTDALRGDATALIGYLKEHFSHPAGGYEERMTEPGRETTGRDSARSRLLRPPSSVVRRHNPHMHLFEACLAADAAFGGTSFLAVADEIAELFFHRFFQVQERALPEFFDSALAPQRLEGRFLVEPGHHYEWAWLMDRYAQRAAAAGRPARPDIVRAAEILAAFADQYGIDPEHGLVVNALWSDGAVHDGAFRLWPQTERLRAQARRAGASPDRLAAPLAALQKHFAGAPAGLWIERIDAAGRPLPDPAPATSLYHLTAALTDGAAVAMMVPPA